MSIRRRYEDVGAALGLSQEDTGKLLDLLTEQQTRSGSEISTFRLGMQESSIRDADDIAALIGPEKMPQWEEYQRTQPERSQVNFIREQMRFMGVPLTDDQRARLVDIVIEQHQLNPPAPLADGLSPEEQLRQSMKWQDEADRALLDRAKSVLSREQFEYYRDYVTWQSEIRNTTLRGYGAELGNMRSESAVVVAPPPAPAPKH